MTSTTTSTKPSADDSLQDAMFNGDDAKSRKSGGENDTDSNYSGANGTNKEEDAFLKVGTNETKRVWRLKLAVLLVVIACTVATAFAVYVYTSNTEEAQFEDQYYEYANKVLDSIGATFDNTFGAMDALATDVVAYAKATNQTWPFVYVPFFGIQASKILSIANNVWMSLLPVSFLMAYH
jgi:hypothetical protein